MHAADVPELGLAVILYYAMGGGLGHLTRARAFLHGLGAESEAVLLTASDFAADRRVVGDLEVLRVPEPLIHNLSGYRNWLAGQLIRLRPRTLFLDSFPAGLLGEFCDLPLPPNSEVHHLARLLRWDAYAGQLRGQPPPLATTWALEPLPPAQLEYLQTVSRVIRPAPALCDPPPPPDRRNEAALSRLRSLKLPVWLVVHAGGGDEVVDLIGYAKESAAIEQRSPAFVLAAPTRPPKLPSDVIHLDLYPASLAFSHCERIICAAGFNSVRQTEPYRRIRRVVPMPRRYDDQFLRAGAVYARPGESTDG